MLKLARRSIFAALASGVLFGQPAPKARPFANGVYSVVAEGATVQEVSTAKTPYAVLLYDGKYLEADAKEPPKFVALDLSSFVPMVLAAPPDRFNDDRGHTALSLTLARQHVKTLEDFTQAHLDGRVAIVIDGDIVTMHKVRAVIRNGKAMITRCTDNACQRLYLELTR